MIVWLEKALVLAIHDRQLAEHGGSGGVRDETLLESALARPQQLYVYGDPAPDLANLAASLSYGLARNHPFVDGNKRRLPSPAKPSWSSMAPRSKPTTWSSSPFTSPWPKASSGKRTSPRGCAPICA